MSKHLKISDDLSLPVDATTQAIGWLGRRGSGKSYGATKLAELFYAAGAQFVALDPVGIWYGLRLSEDGNGKGLDVPIFGGLHGDIPLEATGGAMIADVIIDRGLSAVIDVSQFESDADKARFARDFAARFFFRKKASPSAVHVFIEECQEFIPQNIQRGEEQMLHAFQRMVRLGRNYGIGVSMITQRPQDVNKKALNQTECLFCFQLTGPQERKAVEGWVSDKGLNDDLSSILPNLKIGHPHVWSPVWLDVNREILIAPKETFPAGSTPKVGAKPIATKPLEPIEMEKLRKDMAATIEKAKENDPTILKKQVAQLKAELAKAEKMPAKAEPKIVEKPVVTDAQVTRIEKTAAALEREGQRRVEHAEKLAQSGQELIEFGKSFLSALAKATNQPVASSVPRMMPPVRRTIPAPVPVPAGGGGESSVGNSGLRRILIALAQRPGLTNRQIGVRAGLSSGSGSFGTYMSRARSSGWIQDDGERRFITDAGVEALGSYEPLPTGGDLLNYWLSDLGESGAARILRALASVYPDGMTNEQIGQAAEISHTSGSFGTYMSRLRTLELIKTVHGVSRASEELFD